MSSRRSLTGGGLEQALRTMIDWLNIKTLYVESNRKAQRRAFRAAQMWAYTVCARDYYPRWASYLLDEAFQTRGAGRLQACYLEGLACFKPADLAGFWADQIEWLSEEMKQRHVAELVPVASRFMRSLEAELCARPELQPNFDCSSQ